jgi:hypothetical protein
MTKLDFSIYVIIFSSTLVRTLQRTQTMSIMTTSGAKISQMYVGLHVTCL